MIAAEKKTLSYSGFPLRTTYHITFQLKNNFFSFGSHYEK